MLFAGPFSGEAETAAKSSKRRTDRKEGRDLSLQAVPQAPAGRGVLANST